MKAQRCFHAFKRPCYIIFQAFHFASQFRVDRALNLSQYKIDILEKLAFRIFTISKTLTGEINPLFIQKIHIFILLVSINILI